MLYTQATFPAQTVERTSSAGLSSAVSRLLPLAIMAGLVLGSVMLLVAGMAWVVENVDSLLSFQTFKVFFMGNAVVWTAMFAKLAQVSLRNRRAVVRQEVRND